MKTFLPLLVIAAAHLSGALAQQGVAAATTTTSASTASATEDLAAEFLRWKASAAGQQAYASGFVPESTKESVSLLSAAPPTAEELRRFQAAKERVAELQKEQPLAVFSVETPFALMTPEEFKAYVGRGGVQEFRRLAESNLVAQGNVTAEHQAADTVSSHATQRHLKREAQQGWVVDTDWQTKGCVTRIKNQGDCGSCTMFATTAALESGYCAKGGKLYELSEQELISCRAGSGKDQCRGGWNQDNLEWITKYNDGTLCLERDYPYTSASLKVDAPGCRRYEDPNFSCERPNLGAKFFAGGDYSDHTQLEKIVRQQPVAALVTAGNSHFQYYKSGVLSGDESKCPAGATDHAVLIVGFGTLDGVPYWKVKNQWSESWGDHGWWYIERGYQGHKYGACGIESFAHYPLFPSSSDPGLDKRCDGRYGVKYSGTVMSALTDVRKSEHCCNACRQNSQCQAYNWDLSKRTCELLSSVTGENLKTAYAVGARITTRADDLAKKVGYIADNVDYPGNDIMPVKSTSAEDCGDKCSQFASCNAFTWSKWNGGMCYMKTRQPSSVVSSTPAPDGSPYVRSGMVSKCQELQWGVDFPGADLKSVQGRLEDCCGYCRDTYACAAYTWTDYNGGTCYLKWEGYSVAQKPDTLIFSATV